jgi:zinc protease
MKTILLSLIMISFSLAQEVVELKLPNSNKVVIKLIFTNGSICDPVGKEGLTYTTSALITQGGTGELSFTDIQDKIYPMAASYYSNVDKEVTIFTFSVHTDWLDEFYPIVKGLITNPSFSESDFQRVKANQQNYVDQVIKASSDEEYSKMALEDYLFRGTRYQHMIEGRSETVKSITLDDVKNHYKKYYTKNNLMVGIAGSYSDEFFNMLKKDLADLPDTKPDVPTPPNVDMPKGVNVEIISKDGAFGSAIFTGFPIDITRAKDDFAALMVANSYLGEHRKSYGQLYQKIREQRSMNYGDYSYIEWYDNGGGNMLPPPGVPRHSNYFALWIRPVQIAKQLQMQYEELKDVKVGHALFALRMAVREVDKLVNEGISHEDFEATRDFLRSYIKLYISTPADQLGYLMDSKFYGRENYIKEMDKLLAKVTREDVNNAVKKYLQVENMYIAIVTDKSEAQPLADAIRNNEPSPMSYSNIVKENLPEEILAEDAKVANYKLNVNSVEIISSEEMFK